MLAFLATVLPVLVFLLAIALVAEVCDRVGLFAVAGQGLARLARGRVWALWGGIVILCVASTVVLSLDTTAVLVAPVAISVARRCGLPALPFAVTAVWLANTASLLLPVSNLTNLLAVSGPTPLHGHFASHTWAVAASAVLVTVAAVVAFFPSVVRGRFELPKPPVVERPRLVLACAAVVGVLAVLFACGVPPTWPTVVAAIVLAGLFRVYEPRRFRGLSVPWKMALAVLALFVVVRLLGPLGLDAWLGSFVGAGNDAAGLARTAGVGALGANLVNNLPAYLALQPAAGGSAAQAVALLLGVNAGSIVAPWGSLATLLWLWRCKAAGLDVRLGAHVARSAVLALAVLATGVGVLALGAS